MHSITRAWLVRKLQSPMSPILPPNSRNLLLVSWDRSSVEDGHHGASSMATDASGRRRRVRTNGRTAWVVVGRCHSEATRC